MASDLDILRALEKKVLWLASWTIHNANHLRENSDGLKVGGHQASSASLATIMTALYFDVLKPADRVAVKPHASPIFHAIQYLLGAQTREHGVVVALPGPPREMRPMWADHVVPRLVARGAGAPIVTRTLRLARIGESQVADMLGEELLRAPDPVVATYARSDAVDVRISSRDAPDAGTAGGGGNAAGAAGTAAERVAAMTERVLATLGANVWAEGETTWPDAIGSALAERGQLLSVVELGTGGSLARLLGDRDWLRFAEALAADTATAREHRSATGLEHLARRAAELGEAAVGIAVRCGSRGRDTRVTVAVAGPGWTQRERHVVFLGGANGRARAALTAADVVLRAIRAH